jgi:alpha-tubulin suppressor-like RCC1 family protein
MLNMKPFSARIGAAGVLIAGLLAFSSPAVPVQADAGGAVTSVRGIAQTISSLDKHTCYVNSSKVYCWGANDYGQLGRPNVTLIYASPFEVPGIDNAVAVTAGSTHSCALTSLGTVWCWGRGADGRLGYGSQFDSFGPKPVSRADNELPLDGVASIDAGGSFTCAVTTGGALYCWGSNSAGYLGIDTTTVNVSRATLVIASGVSQVATGNTHSCALMTDQTVKCWGQNNYGALGNGSTLQVGVQWRPTLVGGLSGATAITVGAYHSCAIISDKTAKCWGANYDGQLGVGAAVMDVPATATATAVNELTDAVSISAGANHTCALNGTGVVKCWGDNVNYQGARVGNETTTPTVVPSLAGPVALVSGANHNCAIVGIDIKCWGSRSNGQIGDGTGETTVVQTPISIDPVFSQSVAFEPLANTTIATTSLSVLGKATSNVGLGLTYTTVSATASVCTVSGTTVSILGVGTCSVDVTGNPGGMYKYSNVTQGSFEVTGLAPTVATNDATSIGVTTATLNATVNARFITSAMSIEYATSATLAGSTMVSGTAVTGSTDTARGIAVTGLAAGTTYYFRASATNSAGTTTASEIKSFTTLGGKPSATTAVASGISANKATLNASVNANGVSTTVKYRVGKSADLTGDVTVYEGRTITDFADESVPVSISSLVEMVTYYYRVEATNSFGTATGEIKSFTTARPVGVTINSAAEFTNKKTVVLSVTGASGSVSAIVSNDGGFGSSETFTLVDGSAEINWTLVSSRDERLPKQVYVKFVSRFGTQSSNYQDDIILDTTAPVLSTATAVATTAPASAVSVASVRAKKKNGAKITVKAVDANSGIGSVEMRSGASKKATSIKYANPKAKSQTLTVNTKAKTLQVRVIDRAGNPSPWKTVRVR